MELIGKIVWVAGIVVWGVIRYPAERRARRVRVADSHRSTSDVAALAAALAGLLVVPGIYVATGAPEWADYPVRPVPVILGGLLFGLALWVFRRAHKDLGKNWSISLDIRERHRLVADGLYGVIRHPMYTSFLLMAVAQALLLSNWVVAACGLMGFAVFFLLRVSKEERMMLQTFGEDYKEHMRRTKRLIPFLY